MSNRSSNRAAATNGSRLLLALDNMSDAVVDALEQGLSTVDDDVVRARAIKGIADAMPDIFDKAADRLIDQLLESAPTMIADYEALEAAQSQEIDEQWGGPLRLDRMLWVACHEIGEAFSTRHFNVDGYEPAPIMDAQVGLQARSCRVALEVFALLRGGLGAGALARARTLHEIATISAILNKYGSADGRQPDLATRYMRHSSVITWMDAQEYQEVAPKLGYEPFSEEEMSEMREDRDHAVAMYGDQFGKANGWASCLMGTGKAPNGFKPLELLAGADHMRSHYSMASHEVHADAKSWMLNHETVGDVTFRSTGPSPRGMADAGQVALIALNQVTVNTLTTDEAIEERPGDLIAINVLNKLVERACDAFASSDTSGED